MLVDVLLLLLVFGVLFGVFLLLTAPVFLLMDKQNMPNKYWSLIPIVHLFFLARIGETGLWVPLLIFIPIVNVFVHIYLWYSAAEHSGVNPNWAWLGIVGPLVIISEWIIALQAPREAWRPRRA